MKKVIFYTKENCLLCDEALDLLKVIQSVEPFKVQVEDIYKDDALLEEYQLIIPVIKIDDEIIYGKSINFAEILEKVKEENL